MQRPGSIQRGPIFLRTKLDGISIKMYGMKVTTNAATSQCMHHPAGASRTELILVIS
jgi:hypothetical protein